MLVFNRNKKGVGPLPEYLDKDFFCLCSVCLLITHFQMQNIRVWEQLFAMILDSVSW